MKAIRFFIWLLVLCGAASAQTGSWTVYYTQGEVVNADGSVTVTPTVSLTGNDGGWCSMTNNTYGYETPAVMVNGNAWRKGWTFDSDGTYVDLIETFPSVTLPASGQSVDLSYAGKVQGICFSMNDPGPAPPYTTTNFYLNPFVDGNLPMISPAPCYILEGFAPVCVLPWPVLWTSVPRHLWHVNLYSQKKGQTISGQRPTDSRIVSTTNSYSINPYTNPACPSGWSGWYRTVIKIVTDQNGSDIRQDGQNLSELVTITAVNDLGITAGSTGSAVTSGGGYFADIYLVCTPRCPASPGETDAIQQIFDIPPGTSIQYDLNYVNLKYKCNGITANGQ